jgi:ligand-binding SRPBCC domain-containing protein
MSQTFHLHDELFLPLPREQVFAFFADARNLEAITPPWLAFRITTPGPIVMEPGALIDYRLRLRGVPIGWRTRISAWEPPHRFVDEQLRGPYSLWQHEHTFEDVDGGTLVSDRVTYSHFGGRLINGLLVRPDLERIFAYRKQRTLELLAPRREVEEAA